MKEGAMVAAWRQKGLPLMLVLLFHIAHLLSNTMGYWSIQIHTDIPWPV